MVSVSKNVGERSTAKNYRPVSLLSVVSKVFEKFVNNRIVDHLEECGLSSDFQYGFRSSQSTVDLLTVHGSHSILKLKIEENRGESRTFEEKFCKIRGQFRKKSRRIEQIFLTFSNEIKENRRDFSKSMRNGAFVIEAFNITVFL